MLRNTRGAIWLWGSCYARQANVLRRRNEASRGNGNIHLLLGDGFSIALRKDIFSYSSLFDNADFSSEPEIEQLFGALSTQDFEIALRHLGDAIRVLSVYQPEQKVLFST